MAKEGSTEEGGRGAQGERGEGEQGQCLDLLGESAPHHLRLMEEHVITISDNEGERGEGEGEQGQANGGAHDNNLRQRGCE